MGTYTPHLDENTCKYCIFNLGSEVNGEFHEKHHPKIHRYFCVLEM